MAGRTKVKFIHDYSYEFVAPATTLETRLGNSDVVSVIEIPEKRHTMSYSKGRVLKLSKDEAIAFVARHPGVCIII